VAIEGDTQIVFVDTPGLFKTKRRLDRAMVASAWSGASDADVVALLIEAHKGITETVRKIIEEMDGKVQSKHVILVINKIDRTSPEKLLSITKELNEIFNFEQTFMISAEKGHGVDKLRLWLASVLPHGPWLYPEEQIADLPLRVIASEITREKLILRLHQELPYQLTVETERWEERPDGSVLIEQIIYVVRDGHKGIILGNKGTTIKSIGQDARVDLVEFLGLTVHLLLKVKVRPNWQEEKARYTEMGLRYNDGNV
jgi:GTP-binding protein Era